MDNGLSSMKSKTYPLKSTIFRISLSQCRVCCSKNCHFNETVSEFIHKHMSDHCSDNCVNELIPSDLNYPNEKKKSCSRNGWKLTQNVAKAFDQPFFSNSVQQ